MIDTLFHPAGGTEGQLLHLLRQLDRDRFEPHLFCLQGNPWLAQSYDLSPATVLDLRVTARPALIRGIARFAGQLRRGRFDVVQTHFRDGNIVGVLAGAWARGPAIISTRRGVPYWQSGGGLRTLKWMNGRVTRFIANSRVTRERCALAEGVDPRRIEVIYNGLDPTRFTSPGGSTRTRLRAELGLTDATPAVGIVSNFRSLKGVQDLLTAVGLLEGEAPTARFFVVGHGSPDQVETLHRQAAAPELSSRVTFLGPRADVPDLLQAFDIGVLASHTESFSNSILEYLAAGLPVVVTDVGGVREAVEDGREGFIVPPQDPPRLAARLVELLRHPGGPRAFRADPTIPATFHLDQMVRAHEDLYRRVAG